MLRRLRTQIAILGSRARIARLLLFEGRRHRNLSVGRAVRFWVPVRSAGRGTLKIDEGCTLGWPEAPRYGSGEILLQPRSAEALIEIGKRCVFSNNVSIVANARISIGDDCLIGDQVAIYDSDFHELDPVRRRQGSGPSKPVQVGSNVWIGSRAMILKDLAIGDNADVGAMSLVTTDIPKNSIAAGVPARVIKSLA